MDRRRLDAPPLSELLLGMWRCFLHAWDDGRRREALLLADELTASLEAVEPADRERFGWWLCERLFDDGTGWRGQSGGGLSYRDGKWQRPVEYALSVNPLTSRIVVPHLARVCNSNAGPQLRWLWQALVGLKWRLQSDVRSALDATLRSVCGADAEPIDALQLAAINDTRAREVLNRIDASENPLVNWPAG